MSIYHLSYLACDHCLEILEHSTTDTAREARAIGKANGWKRIDGQDVCPKCQKKERRPGEWR